MARAQHERDACYRTKLTWRAGTKPYKQDSGRGQAEREAEDRGDREDLVHVVIGLTHGMRIRLPSVPCGVAWQLMSQRDVVLIYILFRGQADVRMCCRSLLQLLTLLPFEQQLPHLTANTPGGESKSRFAPRTAPE